MRFFIVILFVLQFICGSINAQVRFKCNTCCNKKYITIKEIRHLKLQTKYVIHFDKNYKDQGVRFYKFEFVRNKLVNTFILVRDEAHYTYVFKQFFKEHKPIVPISPLEMEYFNKGISKCASVNFAFETNLDAINKSLGWHPYSTEILDY
jgi:hypothetical protein